MKRALVAAAVAACLASPALAQERVIDVRASRPPGGASFEALWGVYKAAAAHGDADAIEAALREIRRLRIERNILSLEPYALARVAEGLERLRRGERDKAEAEFQGAIVLDPQLPDAYLGMAQAQLKRGAPGVFPALNALLAGVTARFPTILGRHQLVTLIVPIGLLTLMLAVASIGVALLARHAVLLRHDIEERLAGPGALASALTAAVLLLPVIAFQGWAWLPLWWLAVLFAYMSGTERGVALTAAVAFVAVGPILQFVDERLATTRNPLFQAGVLALEGGPDPQAISELEEASREHPQDRDLLFLLAALYKKDGRYEDASALYAELLRRQPDDPYALNNLGNLAFAGGEFQAAIPRYQQGLTTGPGTAVAATLYYNLSLAYLQKFEPQPADEARSNADRLDSGLTRQYDGRWKYEFKNENAVVDLGLRPDELWAKFRGSPAGIAVENVLGKALAPADTSVLLQALGNRFAAAAIAGALAVFVISRWRGSRAFTARCVKCGTPFCRRCHLGTTAGGLCTQCHHLFVVRDGVSGPARNQKLMEVQREDQRRERVFRILSLLAPGAGHVYAHRVVSGSLLLSGWSLVLVAALLTGRVLPFTQAGNSLAGLAGLITAALLLLALYVVANRARPDFEVLMPVARPPRRAGPV